MNGIACLSFSLIVGWIDLQDRSMESNRSLTLEIHVMEHVG